MSTGRHFYFPALLFGILGVFLMLACSPTKKPNFGVEHWKGETLEGETVDFSKVDAPRMVVNFYSPTCQPCIEELPALNYFYDQLRERGIPFYMAVESWPEPNGLPLTDDAPREKILSAVKERIRKDVEKYNIRVPIVIMDESFHIEPGFGLITGTPETLIFSTDPMVLEYNFIGPISTATTPGELESDSRLNFALQKSTGEN